jgi:hypothetical protein
MLINRLIRITRVIEETTALITDLERDFALHTDATALTLSIDSLSRRRRELKQAAEELRVAAGRVIRT